MLSKKLTFSLASLVMLIALGLAFMPAALAAVDTMPEPDLSTTDESAAPGNQLTVFPAIAPLPIASGDGDIDTQAKIDLLITEAQADDTDVIFFIRLKKGVASLDVRGADVTVSDVQKPQLHISDIEVKFYNKDGVPVNTDTGTEGLPIDQSGSVIAHRNTAFPDGRNFTVTIAEEDIPDNARYMTAQLKQGNSSTLVGFQHAAPVDVQQAQIDGKMLQWNSLSNLLQFILVNEDPAIPDVVSIVRVANTATRVDTGGSGIFTDAAISGDFLVKITFTEEPNFLKENNKPDLKAAKDLPFELENCKISSYVKGTPFYLKPHHSEGNYAAADAVPEPTGRDAKYHPYLLTVSPDLANADDVVIRVKSFNDLTIPGKPFSPPSNHALIQNQTVLRVRVNSTAVKDAPSKGNTDTLGNIANYKLDGGLLIPAKGYLVLVRGTAETSGVRDVSRDKYKDNDSRERADGQTDIDFKYNVVFEANFPDPADDLANFFRNGATISLGYSDVPETSVDKSKKTGYHGSRSDEDLAALTPPETIDVGDVVISEIMWGRDEAQDDATQSQWIELHNTTDKDISIDANEWALTFGATFGTTIDSVSNATPSYWQPPGSSGVTQTTTTRPTTSTLVSMSRINVDAPSTEANWAVSKDVGINLALGYIGTPGAANVYVEPAKEEPPVVVPPTPVPPAKATDLLITEIMVPSNGGILPQWIEIKNVSGSEVSLNGWEVNIVNDASDTDVITTSLNITLGEVVLDKNQVALVVTKTGRNSGTDVAGVARTKGDANAGMFDADRIVNASVQLKPATRNYSILSESAFAISLVPPSPITSGADSVGNLVGGWELPMSDAKGERSSIIRREMSGATDILGTDAAGWVLASDTSLLGAYVETYYGDKDDVGTPGYDAIGALPVELSKFTAARDRVTGQVVITWETQSELNNAGFFIKRNEHRTGQFKVVNPTMIPGAGTTSEKQSYTYTDTTAKPNIVYYYQIEDVSLDGNRQTLTRSHRLKGHIGAAGKLTTMWGELKEQQ